MGCTKRVNDSPLFKVILLPVCFINLHANASRYELSGFLGGVVVITIINHYIPEPVFWYYVKEVLNRHELQRFYSLKAITTDIGRGRAWLRCALNEHSLERYVHMLLADKNRLRYCV